MGRELTQLPGGCLPPRLTALPRGYLKEDEDQSAVLFGGVRASTFSASATRAILSTDMFCPDLSTALRYVRFSPLSGAAA